MLVQHRRSVVALPEAAGEELFLPSHRIPSLGNLLPGSWGWFLLPKPQESPGHLPHGSVPPPSTTRLLSSSTSFSSRAQF